MRCLKLFEPLKSRARLKLYFLLKRWSINTVTQRLGRVKYKQRPRHVLFYIRTTCFTFNFTLKFSRAWYRSDSSTQAPLFNFYPRVPNLFRRFTSSPGTRLTNGPTSEKMHLSDSRNKLHQHTLSPPTHTFNSYTHHTHILHTPYTLNKSYIHYSTRSDSPPGV